MKGFTLIEILLVIAIVLTVGFFSTAFPLRLMSQMAVNNSSDEIMGALWKAQSYALAGRGHSSWGVHYSDSMVTLFKGEDYDNRDQIFDEETRIGERVSVAGFTNVVFESPIGRPQMSISNIILTRDGVTTSFSINAEGGIE